MTALIDPELVLRLGALDRVRRHGEERAVVDAGDSSSATPSTSS